MTTLWNDLALAEKYILGKMEQEESLIFEARMLTNPGLKRNVKLQEKIHLLVFHYHRKKLREEVSKVHHKLFNDPGKVEFQKKIFQLFNQ